MNWLTENWGWITLVALPAAASLVTVLVNKFGSDTAKQRWNVVRRIYRRLIPIKEKTDV